MKTILTTTLITLLSGGCLTAQNFHITGMTTDLPDGTLVRLRNADVEKPIDTAYIEANQFQFEGKVNGEHNEYVLILSDMKGTRPAFFFVENTDITIDLRNKKYVNDAVITGGRLQNQQAEWISAISETKQKYDSIRELYYAKRNTDSGSKLNSIRSELFNIMEAEKLNFIRIHPDYEYSAYMLDGMSLNRSNAEIQELFDQLSEDVQQSKYGKQMATYLALSKDFREGDTVENFTLMNLYGEKTELNAFRGKYVYLDFWGSWCGPCRAQHPGLARLYEKYRDKGFEIVSVSLDKDINKWEKAIEEDNMSWTNLIDPTGFKGEVAVTYKVFSVPISFLIDPSGKIISSYVNGDHDLEKRLQEYLKE